MCSHRFRSHHRVHDWRSLARRSVEGARRSAGGFSAPLLLALWANASIAQNAAPPGGRLQDVLPPLPGLEREEPDQVPIPPARRTESEAAITRQGAVFVLTGVMFDGNTVFSNEELTALLADVIGERVGTEDLETLRQRITRFYVDAGYVNSGALLPDQTISDGVLRFQIVEGKLEEIDISGTERLDPQYVERRLRRAAGPPLNVNDIQRQLRTMLDDPLISRIGAELSPGLRPGQSRLAVTVEERPAAEITAFIDNGLQPSVGGQEFGVSTLLRNPLGFGEIISMTPRLGEGFLEIAGRFEVPITSFDTRLTGRALYSRSRIVSEPFDVLNISSETDEFGVGLLQPLYREDGQTLTAGLSFDRRSTRSFLFDDPFSFSEGIQNGESTVSVFRGSLEWVDRSRQQVIAARSTISFGADIFGATENTGNIADGQFISWLGQAQYIRRLGDTGAQLALRGTAQWTDDSLLPLEKFSVGGVNSVRGYREDLQLGDRGWNASLELRIPLVETPSLRPESDPVPGQLSIVPFVDAGRAWNVKGPKNDTLVSIGAGLVWELTSDIEASVFVGRGLMNRPDTPDDAIQDFGVHFALSADLY